MGVHCQLGKVQRETSACFHCPFENVDTLALALADEAVLLTIRKGEGLALPGVRPYVAARR